MFVYLVHHGHSVKSGVDPQRPLSRLGRDQADALSGRAAARGVRPDVIWHSGKLRAKQTADAYWRACNPLAEPCATRWMQPDDPLRLADLLQVETRDLMVVGHMPHLDRLLRRLVEAEPQAGSFPVNGVVAVDRIETGWTERWRLEADAGGTGRATG
jgi:phosphohistidine phosphatase